MIGRRFALVYELNWLEQQQQIIEVALSAARRCRDDEDMADNLGHNREVIL